mmetsp:Transcript_13179/g.30808  ORF Transcript_13179/g.30808 Transcript_13179/m.30808 type:complete len:174 (-) Transcript_13179:66-587(-)
MDSTTSEVFGRRVSLESPTLMGPVGSFSPMGSMTVSSLRGSTPRTLPRRRISIGDVTKVEFFADDLEHHDGTLPHGDVSGSLYDDSPVQVRANCKNSGRHQRKTNQAEEFEDSDDDEEDDNSGEVNHFLVRAEQRRARRALTATVGRSKTGMLPSLAQSPMWQRRLAAQQAAS